MAALAVFILSFFLPVFFGLQSALAGFAISGVCAALSVWHVASRAVLVCLAVVLLLAGANYLVTRRNAERAKVNERVQQEDAARVQEDTARTLPR